MQWRWKRRLSATLVLTMAWGGLSSLASPREAAAASDPAWASNAEFWLKADEGVTTNAQGTAVQDWAKKAGEVNFTVNGGPGYRTAGANFNPVVTFDNTGNGSAGLNQYLSGDKNINFADAYAVFKGETGTVVGSVDKMASYGASVFGMESDKLHTGNGSSGTYYSFPFPAQTANQRFHMAEYDNSGDPVVGILNGQDQTLTNNGGNAPKPFTFQFKPMIGGTNGGGSTLNWYNYKGEVAEVIVFPGSTAAYRNQIQSYLALKYGLTLNAGLSNYVDSSDNIVWSNDAVYKNRITGIGQDTGSTLNQRQSKSQDAGALVTIAAGNAIQASNKDIAADSINDKEFLIFGDNNGSVNYQAPVAGTNLKSMGRVFKASKKGDWTNNDSTSMQITLQLDAAALSGETYLLVSNNDTFDGSSDKYLLSPAGKVTIDSSDLGATNYFTFANVPKAPGGVNGASLWLKADKGAAANGQELTGWTDQTGTNQFTVKGAPTYKNDAANFNPAVTFNNTNLPSQNPNQYLIGNTPITYQDGYAVFKLKDGTIIGSTAPRPGGYGAAIFSKWGNLYVGNGATGTYRGFPFNDVSRYYLGAFDATIPIQDKGRLNGKPQAVKGDNTFSQIDFTPVIGGTFGGGNSNNWSHLKGELAEVILYPAGHNEQEKQKIESYLALKYGLTLNGGTVDYTASNGTAKMWTAANNAGYGKRITGIGRDDGSELLQKQSKSQEQGALVTIALGSGVAPSNTANANTIADDLSFFVFSDNGEPAKYESTLEEDPSDSEEHLLKLLNREFKVEKSNWTDQDITLKLDVVDEDPKVLYYLVIDDVTTHTITKIKLDAEGKATFDSGKLNSGSTFTFAKVYKNILKAKLSEIEKLTPGNYTDGWSALQTKLGEAEGVLENAGSTQKEVDDALTALKNALDGLKTENVNLLSTKVAGVLDGLVPGDYTPESWNALIQAKTHAETLLNPPSSDSTQLGQALTALELARVGLVDLRDLRAEVNVGEHLQQPKYTTNSWQVFSQALTKAQAVLEDNDATQDEVNAAKSELEAARNALVDKSVLESRKNTINDENLQQSIYTPGSWEVLQRALAQAESVLGDPNATQADVDEARDRLIVARKDLVPVNNPGNNPGGNGGNGGTGTSGPSPTKQTITVDVLIGGENPADITKVDIERTTHSNGRITDQVTFTPEKAVETAEKAKKTGKNIARIVIPDTKDEVSEVKVDVPRQAFATLVDNKINLEIYTDNAIIHIPYTSLTGLEQDFYFRLVPIKDPDERAEVEQRARTERIVKDMAQNDKIDVVARPMTIETNLSSRAVTLTLPLKGVKLPQEEQARQAYLNELVIFIEHTDGDKDLVDGEAVKQANGEYGLRFSITKFSTFTILHMDGKKQADRHVHYINGYKDGTFKPNQGATRAELAAMLVNLGAAKSSASGVKFPDVPASHWAANAVSQVTATGIMKGYPDGQFQPNRKVTRAEMAATVYKYLKLNKATASGKFKDVAAKHWANGMISAVVEAGFMGGYSDGTFRPEKELTRAEAVTILNRIFKRGPLYGTESSWSDVPDSHWAYHDIEEASRDHAYKVREQGGEQWVSK